MHVSRLWQAKAADTPVTVHTPGEVPSPVNVTEFWHQQQPAAPAIQPAVTAPAPAAEQQAASEQKSKESASASAKESEAAKQPIAVDGGNATEAATPAQDSPSNQTSTSDGQPARRMLRNTRRGHNGSERRLAAKDAVKAAEPEKPAHSWGPLEPAEIAYNGQRWLEEHVTMQDALEGFRRVQKAPAPGSPSGQKIEHCLKLVSILCNLCAHGCCGHSIACESQATACVQGCTHCVRQADEVQATAYGGVLLL